MAVPIDMELFHGSAAILDVPYRSEAVHAPERVRPLIARIGEREQGMTAWIRAAQADGRLKAGDPEFAAALLQGQIKALAFWPQMTMGAPPLTSAQQAELVEAAVSMFVAYFGQSA